ncbi:MAG: polysaccharide deacetylase family protein [Acidobacteriaceae bacterium]|nr:polysaccharide deacetylase family protein [Acidobacteriaceae bacterium]
MSFLQRIMKDLTGGFILAFHEIPAERFVSLVESLGSLEPVPLDTLIERSKARKSTSGLFAITVDDCVGENTRRLVKVLEAKSWPATFYVPTLYLDSGEGMPFQWWFKLAPFLEGKVVRLKSQDLDFSVPESASRFFSRMETLWHTQRPEAYVSTITEMVEALILNHGIDRATLTPPAPLPWEELTEFSRNDLIRFESHGVTHSAMSSLSTAEVEFEMLHSNKVIAEHTGRKCRHLAYPFGSPRSIGTRAAAVAARYYDSATTMSLGSVDHANPWLVPRIPLYPENSHKFAQIKILLKCCKPVSLNALMQSGRAPRFRFSERK